MPDRFPLIDVPALRPFGVAIRLTTRAGGVSGGGYATANLARHVGDDPAAVAENRRRLAKALGSEPLWLNQVHGTALWHADRGGYWEGTGPSACSPAEVSSPASPTDSAATPDALSASAPTADGAVTAMPGRWLALLTADCLPVVLFGVQTKRLAVAHAGWRGLAAGILDAAAVAVGSPFVAWIGPAICGRCYEIDEPVAEALRARVPGSDANLVPSARPGHFLADLPALAARSLARLGGVLVVASGECTYESPKTWYSHRQAGPQTGRFATLAALVEQKEKHRFHQGGRR